MIVVWCDLMRPAFQVPTAGQAQQTKVPSKVAATRTTLRRQGVEFGCVFKGKGIKAGNLAINAQ